MLREEVGVNTPRPANRDLVYVRLLTNHGFPDVIADCDVWVAEIDGHGDIELLFSRQQWFRSNMTDR